MTDRSEAVLGRTFTDLMLAGRDAAAAGTWDPNLSRRTRILVPADVQAFVVPPAGGEPTVPVTGGPGDPVPFAAGAVRPPGVHLHWAMPDALLAGGHDADTSSLALPPLPDRWVVLRVVQPAGARQVSVTGWVIDAKTTALTPLREYAGTPAQAPAGSQVLDPLDGAAGGSLLWTASYTASAGRFTFHDPLADLPVAELFGDQAVYTVAGWWTEQSRDPLSAAAGPAQLDAALASFGWHVVHDADDGVLVVEDPRLSVQRAERGLASPQETAPVLVENADGRLATTGALAGVDVGVAVPAADPGSVVVTPALPRYDTLVHGSVLGVPVAGELPAADDRPEAADVGVALGQDLDDVAAAFGAAALNLDAAARQQAETLVAAFASGRVGQLATQDGLVDLAEREHAAGFWALAGTPLPAAKPDRLADTDSAPLGPLAVGRKGRAAQRAGPELAATVRWSGRGLTLAEASGANAAAAPRTTEATADTSQPSAREVIRPAPRYFRPHAPVLALRGAHPSHRHHGDGLYDDSGRLRCRYPRECVPAITGVVSGAAVLPTLGSGAVPDEVLTVAREAVLLNPYGYQWLAAAGAPDSAVVGSYTTRIAAEMVRLYGSDGRYDGSSHLTDAAGVSGALADRQLAQELAKHSLLDGTPPSPVALTTWRQPWVPLWLEWRVVLDGSGEVAGWNLADIDLQPAAPVKTTTVPLTGRSPVGLGVATTLLASIRGWLDAEQQRDATASPGLPPADEATLRGLLDLLGPLDLVSASLDGIREQLLGIPYAGVLDRGTGPDPRPTATGLPLPLFGGILRLDALRLVDAFGRVLDVGTTPVTTADLEVAGASMLMRPRIQHLARWLFRLVDPGQPAATAPQDLREAYVDQIDPASAVNPVAGFLLPDHIDEELEAFTVAGDAIGQLGHDSVTGAVTWEIAPGRALAPDTGPLAGLDAHASITGQIAAGLVAADAAARALPEPPASSALSALLRVIDTTLWTVDTFAAVGSATIAGLVGRPVAAVRAVLRLDAPDDTDEVQVTAPGGTPARQAAFAALGTQRFPVRLGTLARSDDGLLGFYLDDDYAHLYLVDRVVAAQARQSGRQVGQLGLLGAVIIPAVDPLDHPYLVPDGTLWLRPGQTAMLTLLMLPVGRVHLTSGILPRKHLALADSWVTPGLRQLVPSARVGPVLVDPAEIRLPVVNLLGPGQTFTRRTGPLTWRDDPIVAATQTAYLPRLPHEAQEGWVRVTAQKPEGGP